MGKEKDQKRAQKMTILGKNIVLRGEIEESKIALTEKAEKDLRRIKELKVFLAGPEVELVKEGDEVRVDSGFLNLAAQTKQINPFYYNGSDYKDNNEFYILATEDDIIGKF